MVKSLILILAVAAVAAASPLAAGDMEDTDIDPTSQPEKMLLDLEELGLEFFPNGTVKQSSIEELLSIYNMKKAANDYAGNKTKDHFELEEDEEDGDENERSKRAIFRYDERVPIPDSILRKLPFCSLAYMNNGCTAIFIGPNQALTAGRCVYDRPARRHRTGLRLYRRRNCDQYGVSMSVTRTYTVNGYALNGKSEYDYGMVVTSQRSPCWASIHYHDPWTNRGFDLLGYPPDKQSGCTYSPAYFSSCSYSGTSRSGLYLQHRCDTSPSTVIGAPLISEIPDRSGTELGWKSVYGVNVYSGSQYNYGPRINRDRFYQLIAWMRATGYDPFD